MHCPPSTLSSLYDEKTPLIPKGAIQTPYEKLQEPLKSITHAIENFFRKPSSKTFTEVELYIGKVYLLFQSKKPAEKLNENHLAISKYSIHPIPHNEDLEKGSKKSINGIFYASCSFPVAPPIHILQTEEEPISIKKRCFVHYNAFAALFIACTVLYIFLNTFYRKN